MAPGVEGAQLLRLTVEEPGSFETTPAAVAAAGCARPDLWRVEATDFAGELAAPGALTLHAAPCLCVARPEASATSELRGTTTASEELVLWETLGDKALEPCLPEHPWFARGGSGYLIESLAGPVADYVAADLTSAAAVALSPALACAGLLSLLTRLLSRRGLNAGRIRRELESSAVGALRPDGSLGLVTASPPRDTSGRWASCFGEAVGVLGRLLSHTDGGVGGNIERLDEELATSSWNAVLGPSDGKAQRILRLAESLTSTTNVGDNATVVPGVADAHGEPTTSRVHASPVRPFPLVRRQWRGHPDAPVLELCPRSKGSTDDLSRMEAIRHLPLGTSGAVAHVLAMSSVEDQGTAMLEALLYVDSGRAGGAGCTAAFTVGPCRTLPKFQLLEWRCQFEWHGLGGGGKHRLVESSAALVSHFGTEAILRCPIPRALRRHLVIRRMWPSRNVAAAVAAAGRVRLIAPRQPEWSMPKSTGLPLCFGGFIGSLSSDGAGGGQLSTGISEAAHRRRVPSDETKLRRDALPPWGLVGCSAPMWLSDPVAQAPLVHAWLAYHRLIGLDRMVVYDLDGSLAEVVAPYVDDGFVIYIGKWPKRMSPGACESLHEAAKAPGRSEESWMRYCTQTQAEQHCAWNLRGRARWALLLHSFDAYASSSSGLHEGVAPLLGRLEPLRHRTAALGVLRYDFGGRPNATAPPPSNKQWTPPTSRFLWRQRAPLFTSAAGRRGGLDEIGTRVEDHAGATLVNPMNVWTVFTHWTRGRAGTVHLAAPPELLRLNHYVDIFDRPRCEQAASMDLGDPPCDVFDNSSAWLTATRLADAVPHATGLGLEVIKAPAPGHGAGAGAVGAGASAASNAVVFSGRSIDTGDLVISSADVRVLVIVPGHGKPARSEVLNQSLHHIRAENWWPGSQVECLVFVYNDSPEFLEAPYTRAFDTEHGCNVQVRPGKVFMEYLLDDEVDRMLSAIKPTYVFMLLDDIALDQPPRKVSVMWLMELMLRNGLDVASPAVVGTHLSYNGMWAANPRRAGAMGRLVSFIEWQATMFTGQAFEVLRIMIHPHLSKTWGYDELYRSGFISATGRAPRMGLIDAMHAIHTGYWGQATTLDDVDTTYQQHKLILAYFLENFNITPMPIRMRLGYVY